MTVVGVISVTMLSLAAALAERTKAENELQVINKTLEARVADRTERLEVQAQALTRANAGLETLLHVTSHDLREPLRAIESFSSMMQEEYVSTLDERGKNLMWRIGRAASRLDHLLVDIVALSQLRQLETPKEEIDGNLIVQAVLERLEETIKKSMAKITVVADLPRVRADKRWAVEALYNLVTNAIKYKREGSIPEIEISSYYKSDNANEIGFAIKDRGIGVEPEHAERIFKLFQRAVGREIEGTGAGLAIVQEVANRHNGRVWVQPRVGGGSEFIITFGTARGQEDSYD